MSETKDKGRSEANALFKLVRKRYGDRLSPAELEEVRKGIETLKEAAETLRAVKLGNSDEPFFVFRPLRKEE